MEGEEHSKFNELLKEKHKLQKKLTKIFMEHLYNYFTRIFKKAHNYIEFQRKMIKIADWKESKKQKKVKKFIKWCLKNGYDIENIYETIITYSIRTILNDDYLSEMAISKYYKYTFDQFFYKVLKRTAKYYYENPKIDIINNDDYIYDIINTSIIVFIPINKLVDMYGMKKDDIMIQYNFNNLSESSDDISTQQSKSTNGSNYKINNLIIEKQLDNESLQYLPSEEFSIEFTKPNDKQQEENDDDEDEEEKNTRHISFKKHFQSNVNKNINRKNIL